MRQFTFHLDFLSPYAYLAFEKLPEALMGLSYSVVYKPVFFGAMLQHNGLRGPAEIPGKREWTFRQIQWLAHSHGVELQMPALHPFNPLQLLRLAVACEASGLPNRYACETIFRHVWQGGADASDAGRFTALQQALAPQRDPAGGDVKSQLKRHTDEAIAQGIFGVPSFVLDDKVFWGFDSLAMLRACLAGDAWFDGPVWEAAARQPSGLPLAKTGS